MKTILVLTDFSEQAENATHYAYQFAKLISANLILYHAFGIPEKNAIASQIAWPINYDELEEDSLKKLKALACAIKKDDKHSDKFEPAIKIENGFGAMADLASELILQRAIGLVVIGGSKSNRSNRLLFGSDTYDLLDKVMCPVLFIPDGLKYHKVERITYATDLRSADTTVIRSLSALSSLFNAQVMVTHVSQASDKRTDKLAQLMEHTKTYPNIDYQHINSKNIVQSLCELNINASSKTDMLALIHKKYHFPESIFHTSISKQMTKFATIPLIIYPFTFVEYLSPPTANQL